MNIDYRPINEMEHTYADVDIIYPTIYDGKPAMESIVFIK